MCERKETIKREENKSNDVTDKYKNMIDAFSCDYILAKEGLHKLSELNLDNENISRDIKLLEELSWKIRRGIIKIIETE